MSLTKQLRRIASVPAMEEEQFHQSICRQAADRLDELRAELAAVSEDNSRLRNAMDYAGNSYTETELKAELATKTAECERLKESLRLTIEQKDYFWRNCERLLAERKELAAAQKEPT